MNFHNIKKIPGRIFVKYGLVNLIGLAFLITILLMVRNYINFPMWLFWTIIALSVIKDFVLFPFVWQSYDSESKSNMHTIIGQHGMALETLEPEGYIYLRGERWKAEIVPGIPPIKKGETVKIKSFQGLKVFVVPDNIIDN